MVWSEIAVLPIKVPMQEPSPRTSRLVIAAALTAAAAIGTAGFLLGRSTSPGPGPSVEVAPQPAATAQSTPAPQPRTLSRADIIALGDRAADVLSSGRTVSPEVAGLAGRHFDLAIPFGCSGPSPDGVDLPLGWRYDTGTKALRIHVSLTEWQAQEWNLADPSVASRKMEGLWISWPWSSSEVCPEHGGQAGATDAQPITLPGQTLAVGRFVPVSSDGKERAQRAFDIVKQVAPQQLNAERGFVLRLTGRIDKLPGGQPVRCIQPAGIEQKPICLVAVSLEEVRVQNPVSGDTVAIWSIGQAAREE
ncbi:hypothetical protein [Novosphingobium album (ex Liu et al. 2023)]|uniref:Uncharacterized protein n=1 Tax=Novosphingobium album (ex Liu et al. 2023) TaxID=3031130 RepID=A0ABT5WXR0_9SPHN|nr:hypothetical protein [Novosphingobium album (ex Liu et al. 2023)]MDE8654682.1 hypothetical protein [Novosphingobium album (ex Liu et al. 2023)]